MIAALVCVVWVALLGEIATAGGKTSKVTIETDPPGAKVYFGLKEDGAVCTTPCTIDAPIGETAIIIEAENRRALIENLVVPRRTAKPLKVQYRLELATGALVVEGGDGATIKVDGEARGTAPRRIDGLAAGSYRVVLEANGAAIYSEVIEIVAGNDAVVSAAAIAAAAPAPPPAPPAVVVEQAAPRLGPSVAVAGVFDIAFRQFTYKNNRSPAEQRNDREAGQLLAGPIIEVWPTTLLDIDALHGLSLYGRFAFGLNGQAVEIDQGGGMRTSLTTKWRSLEVSVHHRWQISQAGSVEVGAGFSQERYQFNGRADEVRLVPDASYDAVRIGGRASLRFGNLEPYLTTENRLVLSGGVLDDRYGLGTSVNGVHGSLGAVLHLGDFNVRLEGALTLYSWTFKPDANDPMADGGSDFIQKVSLAVGYVY